MNETLITKIEKATEDYVDLLIKRIETASRDLSAESTVMVDEGARMVIYMANVLEKLNRLNRGNETDGQCD